MELVKHWAAQLDDYVIDLAWSPDGEQLGAASATGPISLYDAQSGVLQHTLPGHEGGTNCIAWKPFPCIDEPPTIDDGSQNKGVCDLLASGGQESGVKFWDATNGQHCATAKLEGGSGWVEHLAWKPALANSPNKEDYILAAASGRQLYALRPDGSVLHRFPTAPKSISALAWRPDGNDEPPTIDDGSAATNAQALTAKGALRTSSDGSQNKKDCVLAAAYFGGVQLWSTSDFSPQKELPYVGGIESLVWSPDCRWLVSGNHDPSVHLWRPNEDLELQMSGYDNKVAAIAFDARSRWLATSGSTDCCVWDCSGEGPEGREPAMLPHGAKLCAVAFQNAHGLLAAASEDGTVKLWSVERALGGAGNSSGKPLRATVSMPAAATRLAWSPDDSLLAIGTTQGIVYTLKVHT